MANVTEMPPTEAPTAETSGTSAAKIAPRKTGRPRKGEEPDPETRAKQFFDRAAQIPSEDWGNRAWMYLYIDEPVCDEKQWGKMRYAKKLHQPIFDLEKVKDWYGSCKGWISLNLRKPDAQNTDQIGRHEFEIFDIHCPPKIPKACWTDDPANKKWAALLPPEPKAQTESATSLLDSIKVYKEIRDKVREEREEPEAPMDQTRSTLETMKLAKELFAPSAASSTSAPAPPADPFDTAKKIMDMRANDPMVATLLQRLDSMDKSLEAARAREFELLKERSNQPPPVAPKGIVEQLTDIAAISDKLAPLKNLFGFGNGVSEAPVRAGRTGALDVIQTLGTKFFESDLASGVGQWLGAMAQRSVQGNGAPVQMSNPGTHLQPQNEQQQFAQFIEQTLNPALRRFYSQGLSGGDFAGWLYDAFPDRLQQLQNFTHPLAPGMKGAPVIVAAYKRTPDMWSLISSLREGEPSFVQFVNEFCRWKPESSEQSDVIDAEIVHEGEDGEGEPERVS